MIQQYTLMKVDPATGEDRPYPSHAQQWRNYHGKAAWLFNPWTGGRRFAEDVGSDPFGLLILPEGEPLYAHPPAQQLSEEEIVAMAKSRFGWAAGLGGFDDAVLDFARALLAKGK